MTGEAQIHDQLIAWLRKMSIPFRRDRMDKRTTTTQGEPDFACYWCGRVAFVEIKTATGKLRPAQEKRLLDLRNAGCEVAVCRDLESAVSHIESQLDVNKHGKAPAQPRTDSGPCFGYPEGSFQSLDCVGTDGCKTAATHYLASSHTPGLGMVVVRAGDNGEAVFVRMATDLDRHRYGPWTGVKH